MEWVQRTKGEDGRMSLARAKRYGALLRELGSEAAAAAALQSEAKKVQ